MKSVIAGCLTVVLFLLFNWCGAQTFPDGFSQVQVVNGISNPTVMAFAPDGRIFVAQQNGALRVIKNDVLLPAPFVNLTVNSSGERGLIGIALDPDFASNNYIYLYYTVPGSPPHNRISRFTADGDVAAPGSEEVILELDNLSGATNHNGGAMHFGLDGKLYVAVGDNASGSNAQSADTYHGKLLRINKDGSAPADNPFEDGNEHEKLIWSYGLRNPYTFDVQPETGRIFVNDVGQNTWEEINDATEAEENFGWPAEEGDGTDPAYTNPVYAYHHSSGDPHGCAITGGTFFNPTQTNYPASYIGRYFFQDYCEPWIYVLDFSGAAEAEQFAINIAGSALSLDVGNDGNLYYLSRSAGALYKIIYNNTTSPFITKHPQSLTVSEGQAATFSVTAVGSMPLTYQWQKGDENIPGATGSTYTIAAVQPGDAGQYRVVVSNELDDVTSDEAILSVTAFNDPPVAEILTPAAGTTYVAGTDINFSGSGADPEDGDLAAAAFSWQINFHHDDHKHDQPALEDIKSGTFAIPDVGETSANVFYRIILTVTDAGGLTGQDSVDVLPRKSTITLATDPEGLEVTLDGQPLGTPGAVVSVEGIKRMIGVVSPQVAGGVSYQFVEWLHGGEATQVVVTPTDDVTYTAKFAPVTGADDLLGDDIVNLYPNPVSKEPFVTITVYSQRAQQAKIQVADFLARELFSFSQDLEAGNNELAVPVQALDKGMYAVVLEVNNRLVVRKFIKR